MSFPTDPAKIVNMDEFRRWHAWNIARLEEEHKERMAVWEYMRSDAFKKQVADEILGDTHAAGPPPWEDD